MNKRNEHFEALQSRIGTLGKAVFGEGLRYEVTVPVEDTHCDATITFDHVITVSVYEPGDDEKDAPIFYWGTVTYFQGHREEPPSEDFNELGNAKDTGHGLDQMLKAVFQQIVEVRWCNQLDAEADAAEDL